MFEFIDLMSVVIVGGFEFLDSLIEGTTCSTSWVITPTQRLWQEETERMRSKLAKPRLNENIPKATSVSKKISNFAPRKPIDC